MAKLSAAALTGGLLCGVLPGLAGPAGAVPSDTLNCGPREDFTQQLRQSFRETAHGAGLASPTRVVELWLSRDTGSFSILLTRPDGTACVIVTGENWTERQPGGISPDPPA